MIVTSKKCFLNILTQTCDLQTLLNANYYIADIRFPDGMLSIGDDSLLYNSDGQIRVVNESPRHGTAIVGGRYFIKYDSNATLDPSMFVSQILMSMGADYQNPEELFEKHLNSSETLINVYDFLFKNKAEGNGLQIVIFDDEDTVKNFCHMICEYLSSVFGCNIIFIDPVWRKDVKGVEKYIGCDESTAIRNIMKIRDMKLIRDFNIQCLTSSSIDNTLSNMNVFLSSFDCPSLIHLYNLIFPNDPLPPDNYTTSQLKEIIIGKAIDNIPKPNLNNILFADSREFFDYIDEYDDEE